MLRACREEGMGKASLIAHESSKTSDRFEGLSVLESVALTWVQCARIFRIITTNKKKGFGRGV